ncbi:MAG: hypothetical protein GTN80_11190 [Nitrososphaeria archaeon]|nr:hypothetical protein [Nitrososphaeria archaeon]
MEMVENNIWAVSSPPTSAPEPTSAPLRQSIYIAVLVVVSLLVTTIGLYLYKSRKRVET